jgi:PDZ domain-containing protein
MNRRTAAGLLALALCVALGAYANRPTETFSVFSPGPTFNTLGSLDGKQVITITGHPTYRDDGQLRFVTVYVTQPGQPLTLVHTLVSWIDPSTAVLPHDAVYRKGETNQSSQAESAVQMTDSQDDATAAALTAAGIRYTSRKVHQIGIAAVDDAGPAAGLVRSGDVLVAVQGKPVTTSAAAVTAISALHPGSKVELGLLREGVSKDVTITTVARPDDASKARVGVSLSGDEVSTRYSFPFKVSFGVSDNIGGPSAGMMFALSVYDLLTPGSITGGRVIAGSGEISPTGVVSPIGGIAQKLVGAQDDGAKLFLVAAENCAEASKAHYDHGKMRLVKVHTLSDAIKAVDTWRENPKADLPACS